MPYPIPIIKIILLFCLLIGLDAIANAQNDSTYSGMKKFDFNQFQLNNPEGLSKTDTLANGDIAYYSKSSDGDYYITIESKSNGYTYHYNYDNNGNLRGMQTRCYNNCSIGKGYSFDAKGNIIKEVDYDAPFTFTFDDFFKKVKEEFGYDIKKHTKRDYIRRFILMEGVNKPLYILHFDDLVDPTYRHAIIIDGETGETGAHEKKIDPRIKSVPKDYVSPLEQYIDSLIHGKKSSEKKSWSIFD